MFETPAESEQVASTLTPLRRRNASNTVGRTLTDDRPEAHAPKLSRMTPVRFFFFFFFF